MASWRSFGLPPPSLVAPALILLVLGMLVLPLPAWLLDLLFTLNMAAALMVVVVVVRMVRPLDFAAFPSVLLLTTLLRLSLNVASSRIVLLEGHTGPGAAGAVIEAFGQFLIGGHFAVGFIVFAILVVINFVVVTKGAVRIAEVAARFALDAMPGKQMAIDADLAAGLIDETEARRRRTEIGSEAEFFGSMDGASKFVRGDAIAGLLILALNLLGGFLIGVGQHDMDAAQAARVYGLLAVGDALVAQIPGLLISVAAAMVVTRVGKEQAISAQIATQMFGSPSTVGLVAGVIALLGVMPGMPHLVFLVAAVALGGLARAMKAGRPDQVGHRQASPDALLAPVPGDEVGWDDLQPVDTLGIEVGYRLIGLVDQARGGALIDRIKDVRRKFAQELGFLPPSVRIRDNLALSPGMYRLMLRGAVMGEGEVHPGRFLAINPGHVSRVLPGLSTTDPAFGLPAIWVDEPQREAAQMAGYTVVDSSTVLATHLSHLMQQHAARLLGRTETQALVAHMAQHSPQLIQDVIPQMIGIASLQKALQSLLEEGVHIRDMRSIIESLAEQSADGVSTADERVRRLRVALAPAIVQQVCGQRRELDVITLAPGLAQRLARGLGSPDEPVLDLDPDTAEQLGREALDAAQGQAKQDQAICLLVPDLLRLPLSRLLRRTVPRLKVLAFSEIPDTHSIRIGSIIGAQS
jgi:flagellar biosynthesis protein FlhA